MKTTPLVTAGQLTRFSVSIKESIALSLAPALSAQMVRRDITTPRRIRHFLAQVAHECAGFRSLEENLNYSAARLCQVWPKRFPTLASAQPYANNPQALGNKVYGGRMGNTLPTSGYKYRGRSPIMLTGYDGYVLGEELTGLPLVAKPDLAALPENGAIIATSWWASKGLNAIADADAGERIHGTAKECVLRNELDDMQALRKRINGGFNGLEDTKAWLLRACTIWPDR